MSEPETRTPDEIRREIEHTREELAETAAALAERADVKARAHEKVEETRARITEKVEEARAKVTGTAGAAKDKATDATRSSVADTAQQAADSARVTVGSNPLPAALIAGFVAGALIGWLVRSRR